MPRAPLTVLLLGVGALPTSAEPHSGTRADQQAIASVTLSPSSVIGGGAVAVVVTLSENAGPGGVKVTLQSSKPAIATVQHSTVEVQPGTRTASFVVQTKPVSTNPNVVTNPPFADIAAGGFMPGPVANAPPTPLPAKSARLTVLPPALASLTLSPASVSGGVAALGEVRLTGPAPAGGLTIRLSSKVTGADPAPRPLASGTLRSSVVSVPAQVIIPAGASSATFTVTTLRVTAATPAQVTAAYGAFGSKSVTLTIIP